MHHQCELQRLAEHQGQPTSLRQRCTVCLLKVPYYATFLHPRNEKRSVGDIIGYSENECSNNNDSVKSHFIQNK